MNETTLITKSNNDIKVIPTGVVIKKYTNALNCFRENEALLLLKALNTSNVPNLIFGSSEFNLIENITPSVSAYDLLAQGIVSKQKIMDDVIVYVGSLYNAYQSQKQTVCINDSLYFSYELNRVFNAVVINSSNIAEVFGNSILTYISESFEKLSKTKYFKSETFVSTDLHLSNILYKVNTPGNYEMFVIDFENAQIGPIELEFQNSLFFDDAKSLDVTYISRGLNRLFDITYSKELESLFNAYYIAKQILDSVYSPNNDRVAVIKKILSNRGYN